MWQQSSDPTTASDVNGYELLHDFGQVWSWTDPVLDGGAQMGQWSFRMDGQWTRGKAEWVAAALGVELASEADGLTYSGTRMNANPAYELQIWYTPTISTAVVGNAAATGSPVAAALTEDHSTEQVNAVVLLRFESGIDMQAIGDAVSGVEEEAKAQQLLYESGFAVRGTAKASDNRAASEAIVRKASAMERETYDDGHTRSVTYSTPQLHIGVDSGGARVNIQIAEVDGDANAEPEIVVGVPLITGDYRAEN